MGNFFNSIDLIQFLLSIPCILLALTVHEVSHGYVAYRLGDPTAKLMGRLTLNPLKHLDPFGAICMLLFHFGWAKPVPINTRYFKKPRRDMALTALAGPVSNLLMALAGRLLYHIFLTVYFRLVLAGTDNVALSMIVSLFDLFSVLNIGLAVFNLIPVPPLDGSRIFYVFLPTKAYFAVMKYERFISIVILVLFWFGILSRPLGTLVSLILNGMDYLIQLIPILI